MLDHITENVARFGILYVLDESPFEDFINIIMMFVRKTSLRRGSTSADAGKLINSSVANEECSSILKGRKRTATLVQDGTSASLVDIFRCTFSYLAHIHKDARKLLTLQRVEIVQSSFQISNNTFFSVKLVLPLSSLDSFMVELLSRLILMTSKTVVSKTLFTFWGACKECLKTFFLAHRKQSVLA